MVQTRKGTFKATEPPTLRKSCTSQRPGSTKPVGQTFDLNETKHVVWTVLCAVGVAGQVGTTAAPAAACVVSFSSRLSAHVRYGKLVLEAVNID